MSQLVDEKTDAILKQIGINTEILVSQKLYAIILDLEARVTAIEEELNKT